MIPYNMIENFVVKNLINSSNQSNQFGGVDSNYPPRQAILFAIIIL